MRQNYTIQELKSHILDYYEEHGKLPRTSDINAKKNCPNRGVFVKYTDVNKWIDVFEKLDIDKNLINEYKIDNNYDDVSKKELIQELYDYKNEYNKPPTTTGLDKASDYHDSHYFYSRFEKNKWSDILDEVDIKSYQHKVYKEDVISDIHRLYDELCIVPNKKHIEEHGKYSYTTYIKHFEDSLHNLHTSLGYKSTIIKNDEISDKELVDDIIRIHNKLDKIPSYGEIVEHTKYTKYLYRDRFGSITNAREKAGFDSNNVNRNRISDDELLSELERVCNLLGKSPTQKEFIKNGIYSAHVYTNRFGGLGNALEKIGYEPNVYYDVSEKELISDIHNVMDKVNRIPRFEDLEKYAKYSIRQYRITFGPHDFALEAAGIDLNNRCYDRISDDNLINELQRLANELSHTPKKKEVKNHGRYSASVYVNRFGGFGAAILEAGLEPNNGHGVPKEELINELHRVSNIINGQPLARHIKEHSKYSKNIYKSNFGSLMNAREEAGFDRYVSSTWIEMWAYNTLDDMGISFEKEVSIGKYRVDVVVDEGINSPYALELDGDYYHKETFKNHPAEGDLDYQNERDKFITNQGYHVIRVWESDIENNEEEIKQELKNIFIYGEKPPKSGNYININN